MSASKLAVITGASSGIGAEFAHQLAHQGCDLLLIGRRKTKLDEIAQTISSKYKIVVDVLPADLASSSGLEFVQKQISQLTHVDLLVNNAGFGLNGQFMSVDAAKNAAMLHVHITASVMLAHTVLSGMVARHSGAIVNVASMAGLIPIRSPLYSSTKAFLIHFSEALQLEVKGSGVHIQALCPGFTYTEFHDTPEYAGFQRRKIPRILWLSSEEVVRTSLRDLYNGRVICIPGFQYKIIAIIARNSVTGYLVRLIGSRFFHK